MRHCWVNTVSREHALVGVQGGFTQADHGRSTRLRRLERGDGLVVYSPRTAMRAGEPLRRFAAIGRVDDDEPHQVVVSPDCHPWRRRVAFDATATPADVRPLLGRLSFVTDEQRWGLPFRRGLFEVVEEDFAVIAEAMGVPG